MQRIIGILGLVFAALLLTGCSSRTSPWVHFKIIVDVEADGKVYSGSSVLGMQFGNFERTGQKGLYHFGTMKGEAPFVEVGERGTLFVLLSINRNGSFSSFNEFFRIPTNRLLGVRSSDLVVDMEKLSAMRGMGSELSCLEEEPEENDCPVMARFEDINIPVSVEQVDPKNLSESFGPNVKLRSIRFEITDEPISKKIDAKLPWLSRTPETVNGTQNRFFGEFPRGIPMSEVPFENSLHDGFFKVEYRR